MNPIQKLIDSAEQSHGQTVVRVDAPLMEETPERASVEKRLPPAMVQALNTIRAMATMQLSGHHPGGQEGQK